MEVSCAKCISLYCANTVEPEWSATFGKNYLRLRKCRIGWEIFFLFFVAALLFVRFYLLFWLKHFYEKILTIINGGVSQNI